MAARLKYSVPVQLSARLTSRHRGVRNCSMRRLYLQTCHAKVKAVHERRPSNTDR